MRRRRLRSSNEGWLTSYADLITNLLIFFALIIGASKIQTGRMEQIVEAISESGSQETLAHAEEQIKKKVKEQSLEKSVRVTMTDEGLELSFDSGVVFNSGSASVLPQMEEPLAKVLEVVRPYSSKYRIAIEGHTDETPMHSGTFKSNWELSSGRAMRIREALESVGVAPERMRVEAYADTKELSKELLRGLAREQVLARHRRVVIRLH